MPDKKKSVKQRILEGKKPTLEEDIKKYMNEQKRIDIDAVTGASED